MKNATTAVGAMLLTLSVASCKDTSKETVVWGTVEINDVDGSKGIDSADGLVLNDSEGYGFCRYQNNKFSFAVGTGAPGRINAPTDYYLIVNDIEGPPSTDPYTKDGTPREDEDRSFSGGSIYNEKNKRQFSDEDMTDGKCSTVLLASAQTGDLTPVKYGKNRFKYLVNVHCTNGLSIQSDPPSPLDINGFSATLWFSECEE